MDASPQNAALSGRKAQAARNDAAILAAARQVFVDNPEAPVAAVAQAAGVGISALYRRYPGKEDLLAKLCLDGLSEYVGIARASLAVADAWDGFAGFLRGIVDSDVHSLTVRLAGRFHPTPEHRTLAQEAGELTGQLLARAQAAGVVRDDVVEEDLSMLYEQLTAVRLGTAQRTQVLRRRYVQLQLDGLRAGSSAELLPGHAPTQAELGARWTVRSS